MLTTTKATLAAMYCKVYEACKHDAKFEQRHFARFNRELRHGMDVLSLRRREAEDRAAALAINESYDELLASPAPATA